MKNSAVHGWTESSLSRPNPIVTFSPVWAEGRKWFPKFGDRNSLLLLRRNMPKQVSFIRAYRGWRASGAKEEAELGEGRAFLRWLQKYELSIEWHWRDLQPHPYFLHKASPQHDPGDEMAKGLSFCIRPVQVQNRNVKLYVEDQDILGLLNLPYGKEEDFLELVMRYVAQRFDWEGWRAPAPPFLDWVISQGKRPLFQGGQLGFKAPIWHYSNGPGSSWERP